MAASVDYAFMESPVGTLLIAGDKAGVRRILFAEGRLEVRPEPGWRENSAALSEAIRQLHAYFGGELRKFGLPLAPEGTPFQRRVWQELLYIPYGATISYGQLADRLGNPNASRAVGLANGANPISIVIPCHRVVFSPQLLRASLVVMAGRRRMPLPKAITRGECRSLQDSIHPSSERPVADGLRRGDLFNWSYSWPMRSCSGI